MTDATVPTVRYLLANGQPLPPHVEAVRQRRTDIHQQMLDAVMGPANDADIDRALVRRLATEYHAADEELERLAREALSNG